MLIFSAARFMRAAYWQYRNELWLIQRATPQHRKLPSSGKKSGGTIIDIMCLTIR
jgi:hypothetical protein